MLWCGGLFVVWGLEWGVCFCVCVYMCLSTPCNSPICTKILAAFLFKPLCPSCATSTIECSIVYARCVCYIVHMMHMVSTALEISSSVVRLFFFLHSSYLCRYNSLPKALCFISLSLWWIHGCQTESPTLSIMLY